MADSGERGVISRHTHHLPDRLKPFSGQGRRKHPEKPAGEFCEDTTRCRVHRTSPLPPNRGRYCCHWHPPAPLLQCLLLVLLCPGREQSSSALTLSRHSQWRAVNADLATVVHQDRNQLQRRSLAQRESSLSFSNNPSPKFRILQSAGTPQYPAPNTTDTSPCTPSPVATCPGTLKPNSHIYNVSKTCSCSSPLILVLGLDEAKAASQPFSLSLGSSNALSEALSADLGIAPTQVWLASLSGTPGTVRTATVWVFPATGQQWSLDDATVIVDRMESSSSLTGVPGVEKSLLGAELGAAQPVQPSTLPSTGPPPPTPPNSGSSSEASPSPSQSEAPTWAIAVIAVLGVLFIGTLVLALVLFLKLRKAQEVGGSGADVAKEDTKALIDAGNADIANGPADLGNTLASMPKTMPRTSDFSVKVAENFVKALSLDDIIAATNNFDENNALGSGGYGTVYKGVAPGGTIWAVKRAKNASQEGVEDFQNEVDVISKMSHRNLVKLLGYCDERGEQILVYEFVSNGTLRQHIRPDNPSFAPLTFQQRLEIAVGSAEGLKYLHSAAEPAIIHRDIKCDNILLDQDMQAKVADFGVFKKSPTEAGKTMNTRVVGTPGYVDPEYYQTYKVTVKSDVYSFGVVLLELITGRPPIMEDPSVENESYMVTLSRWAAPKIAAGKVETIVDPRLHGTYPRQALNMMAAITAMCVRRLGRDRPEMAEVATRLAEIKYFLKPSSGILEPVMNLFPEDRDDADNLNEIPEEDEEQESPEHIPGISGGNPYSTTDIAAPVSMVFSDR